MNSKEKAIELVHELCFTTEGLYKSKKNIKNAKQCALIAVKFAKENPLNSDGYNKYLDEVKKEIELL